MSLKPIIIATAAIATAAAAIIGLRVWSSTNNYSTNYRHTVQTKVTVRLLAAALGSYRIEYGSFPQGDNAAILRQLAGDNPRKTVFVEPPKAYNPSGLQPEFTADAEGRMVDGWNTPLRFKFGKEIRVESAGEDKQFDTPDDLFESFPSR